jgi:hypothetical protein
MCILNSIKNSKIYQNPLFPSREVHPLSQMFGQGRKIIQWKKKNPKYNNKNFYKDNRLVGIFGDKCQVA